MRHCIVNARGKCSEVLGLKNLALPYHYIVDYAMVTDVALKF